MRISNPNKNHITLKYLSSWDINLGELYYLDPNDSEYIRTKKILWKLYNTKGKDYVYIDRELQKFYTIKVEFSGNYSIKVTKWREYK